jgi:hypothetical protein
MRLLAAALAVQIVLTVSARPEAQSQRPSLDGVWSFSTLTPLERPAEFSNRPLISDAEAAAWAARVLAQDDPDRRDGGASIDVERAYNGYWFDQGASLSRRDGRRMTSLIIDPANGRMPSLTSSARARLDAAAEDARLHPADGPESRSLAERCLSFNAGPPMLPALYNNYVRIMEAPGFVVILNEMIHDARIVPIDAPDTRARQPRPPASIRGWHGIPRGRWEGSTLIVESTNFLGAGAAANLAAADEQLRLVERFTRVDERTLDYEFTVDDPTAYTRPWTALLPMTITDARLFEYACHEGNYALSGILRGARAEER